MLAKILCVLTPVPLTGFAAWCPLCQTNTKEGQSLSDHFLAAHQLTGTQVVRFTLAKTPSEHGTASVCEDTQVLRLHPDITLPLVGAPVIDAPTTAGPCCQLPVSIPVPGVSGAGGTASTPILLPHPMSKTSLRQDISPGSNLSGQSAGSESNLLSQGTAKPKPDVGAQLTEQLNNAISGWGEDIFAPACFWDAFMRHVMQADEFKEVMSDFNMLDVGELNFQHLGVFPINNIELDVTTHFLRSDPATSEVSNVHLTIIDKAGAMVLVLLLTPGTNTESVYLIIGDSVYNIPAASIAFLITVIREVLNKSTETFQLQAYLDRSGLPGSSNSSLDAD